MGADWAKRLIAVLMVRANKVYICRIASRIIAYARRGGVPPPFQRKTQRYCKTCGKPKGSPYENSRLEPVLQKAVFEIVEFVKGIQRGDGGDVEFFDFVNDRVLF